MQAMLSYATTALLWTASLYGQQPPKSRACKLAPTAELEKHFGEKAASLRGSDTGTVSICAIDVPDRRHGADLIIHRPEPAAMTVEKRLAALRAQFEKRE